MESSEKIIDRLCSRINADLVDTVDTELMDRLEAVVIAQTAIEGDRKPKSRLRVVSIAAALVLLLIPLVFTARHHFYDGAIPFRVNGTEQFLEEGAHYLKTKAGEQTAIDFSNGSHIDVRENTALSITEADSEEVRMNLDKGALFVNVEGRESAHWVVDTESYRVSVLGTQFWVSWDKAARLLDVRVLNGVVLTEGELLGTRGIMVDKGKHLRVNGEMDFVVMASMEAERYDPRAPGLIEREMVHLGSIASESNDGVLSAAEVTGEPTIAQKDSAAMSAPDSGAQHQVEKRRKAVKSHREDEASSKTDAVSIVPDESPHEAIVPPPPVPKPDWVVHLERSEYEAAILAASEDKEEALVESAGIDEMWHLMNTARRMGRYPLAEKILLAVRRRFPKTRKSFLAPFILGKISYLDKKDAKAAVKWFRIYLSESPNGALTEEAMGRLIKVLEEAGRIREARKAAEVYLKKFPNGRFSESIRTLVE